MRYAEIKLFSNTMSVGLLRSSSNGVYRKIEMRLLLSSMAKIAPGVLYLPIVRSTIFFLVAKLVSVCFGQSYTVSVQIVIKR